MPADRGNTPCPCGRASPYAACCARWHTGAPAPDAEALMRSRYAAFVFGLADYLFATWHPDRRPATLSLDAGTTWLGLDVRRHVVDGDHAQVEFVARFRRGGGRAVRQHETSRFVREDGRWFYADGTVA